MTDYDAGVTVNCGQVSGGQGKNTVPDEAAALFDFRFVTEADGEHLLDRLRAAAAEAARDVPGTRVSVEGGVARFHRTDGRERGAYAAYAACARAYSLGDAGPQSAELGRSTSSRWDRLHRRPRAARPRLPHEGRADRNRLAGAQGAGAGEVLGAWLTRGAP